MLFVDDNVDDRSKRLLEDFISARTGEIHPAGEPCIDYRCDVRTHHWTSELTARVARHKDRMLARATELRVDGVLLVDSDLVLHPWTLRVLRHAQVDIVSEVFWTRWEPDGAELPNVWVADNYALLRRGRDEALEETEALRRSEAFLARLQLPGLHPVGGLGACTLVRQRALSSGVRFDPLPNLTWIGEDRHFCLRAAALGFDLWADSHVPPLHLYRPDDLARIPETRRLEPELARQWAVLRDVREAVALASDRATVAAALPGLDSAVEVTALPNVVAPVDADAAVLDVEVDFLVAGRGRLSNRLTTRVRLGQAAHGWSSSRPRVVLSMLVRNEADRYLRKVIERVLPLVDQAVIVDDGSDDGTPELCEELLGSLPRHVLRLDGSRFDREHELRALQWRAAIGCDPDWILTIDADELLETRAIAELPVLLGSSSCDVVALRLFDMWNDNHFRDDELWCAHRRHWPLLVRPISGPVSWRASDQHCGRWPVDIERRRWERTELRVQHLGWMRAADREAKHARYLRLDPDARGVSAAHYRSILDPAPQLVAWAEA